MKKCTECRSPVKKTVRESHAYKACGLPNVVLMGVPAYVCTKCGEEFVSIPNIQGLHDTLAGMIVEKIGAITAEEVGFLRSWLECDNGEFAALMGVTKSQASRWASGAAPISQTAGNLLRAIVALKGSTDFEVDTLAKIDRSQASSPYAVTQIADGWGQSEVAQA